MDTSALTLPLRTAAVAREHDAVIPWQLAAVVFAASSVMIGLIWDISWHMTIGRDTFWTPAHLAIYTGGAVAGLACGFEVLRRSFFSEVRPADGVTVWKYFNGPLGGWMCIWGATAMLTSGPFDDWWHNAYGLDVKIISPPHALLALGFIAILAGALVMALANQAREEAAGIERAAVRSSRAAWIVAYTNALMLIMLAVFTSEYADRVVMHRSIFYIVAALVYPFALVSAGRAARLAYPATAVATLYTVAMAVQLWILPLFPATPMLGPIRQLTTHMVPLDFPLLLIVPAFVIDLLLQRTALRGHWTRAIVLGSAFVLAFALVQWPFASFLMSESSRNAFFSTHTFPYMVSPESSGPRHAFWTETAMETARGFVIALVIAVLSARAGHGWGTWLRSVRR